MHEQLLRQSRAATGPTKGYPLVQVCPGGQGSTATRADSDRLGFPQAIGGILFGPIQTTETKDFLYFVVILNAEFFSFWFDRVAVCD